MGPEDACGLGKDKGRSSRARLRFVDACGTVIRQSFDSGSIESSPSICLVPIGNIPLGIKIFRRDVVY